MNNEIAKIFEKHPELAEEAAELGFKIMPTVIEALLLLEKIDKSRIDDWEYVLSVVMQNLDVVETLQRSIRIDNQLMESAKDAAKLQRIPVVVILVATTLEHLLNMFYRDTLERRFNLSTEEETEVIRSNIHAKLGWLFKIVSDGDISTELQKQIKQIMDLRNGFVHYKAIGTSFDEKDQIQKLIEQVNDIGLENILSTPMELENKLSKIRADVLPEFEMAKKVVEIMKTKKLK